VVELISISRAMEQVLSEAELAAAFDVSSLLITGEPGAGKEHLARYVHHRSQRRDQPFVVVDCAGEAGGGADRSAQALGRAYEAAAGGTVFFKRVEQLSLDAQGILLHHLAAACGGRAGGPRAARVIAAAPASFFGSVRTGAFSSALYYRLNVVYVSVPALRERRQDIEPLLRHFIAAVAARSGKPCPRVPDAWRHALRRHAWPRNAHELRELAATIVSTETTPSLSEVLLTP
jgi:formate hydrogenlyase transcriptional activator